MNITLDGFLSSCILILIILLYIFIKKYREYARHNKLYKLVSWCVTEDSRIYRYNLHLENYLIKTQSKLNLSQEFQITEEELEYTRVILKKYQQDTMRGYFNNKDFFGIPKSKREVDGETYFLCSLYSYLLEYQGSHNFLDYIIYGNLICVKNIDAVLSSSYYELTDFGIVLYKLLYITLMYGVKKPELIKSYIPTVQIDNLEKAISSKTISIYN